MDLISREDLLKQIEIDSNGNRGQYGDEWFFIDTIKKMPTIKKALEVTKYIPRPQGKWIDNSEDGYVECPFCREATNCDDNIEELHYCWNCGAELGAEQRGEA